MKQRVLILVAVLVAMTASSAALAGHRPGYVALSYVDPSSGFAIQIGSAGYGYAPTGYYGGHQPRYRHERRYYPRRAERYYYRGYRAPVRYYERPHRHYRHHDRHYRSYDRGYRGYRHDRRHHRYDRRWR